MSGIIGAFAQKNAPSFGASGPGGVIKEHNWLPDGGGRQTTAISLITANENPFITTQLPMMDDEMALVHVEIQGRSDDDVQRCVYVLEGLFYRNGVGDTTQQGATNVITSIETSAGLDGVLAINTTPQEVQVKVTGLAATSIRWKVFATVTKVKQPMP